MKKSNEIKVKFLPEEIVIYSSPGSTIYEVAEEVGIIIDLPCGARGKCGKCKVRIEKGNLAPTEKEKKLLTKKEIEKKIRLACCCKITENVEIYIADSVRLHPKRIFSLLSKPEKKMNFSPTVFHLNSVNYEKKNSFGIAFDLGTSTIEASLISLNSGEENSRVGIKNSQIKYGTNIISRLEFVKENKDNIKELNKSLISQINRIIGYFLEENKLKINQILHLVCVGNSFMQYTLMNYFPEELLKIPYRTKFKNFFNVSPQNLSIRSDESSILTLLPGIEGFVGSDTSSLILATDFNDKEGINMAIDMGTNGEIVLCYKNKLVATSCACGPALEGVHISSGMRAKPGAIESFNWEKGNLSYNVMGNKDPEGICGTGLIDIMAYLIENDIIKENGRLENPPFDITKNISITQSDVRQFQLAKAGIRVGVLMLLEKENIDINHVNNLFIAGNFGNFTNPENMIKSTLLPKEFKHKIIFKGNIALEGAKIVVCSWEGYNIVKEIVEKVQYINLAQQQKFQEDYVKAINFID